MNIIIVTDEYKPKIGPCANRMSVFSDILVNKGHNVTVLTSTLSDLGNDTNFIEKSIRVINVYKRKSLKTSYIKRVIEDFLVGYRAYRYAKHNNLLCDVVIGTSPPLMTMIYAKKIADINKSTFVLDVRDIWPDVAVEIGALKEKSIAFSIFNYISMKLYKGADLITTVSKGKVEKLTKKHKCIENKLLFISNGIDENFGHLLQAQRKKEGYLQHKGKVKRISYFGNIGRAQNLDVVVDLAVINRNNDALEFYVWGFGQGKESLEKNIKSKNLTNIKVMDAVPQGEMVIELLKSDVCIATLVNENLKDSIPTKIYEYMAAAKPIFFVGVGDAAELINTCKAGVVVGDWDISVITDAFTKMIDNLDYYTQLALENADGVLMSSSRQEEVKRLVERIEVISG